MQSCILSNTRLAFAYDSQPITSHSAVVFLVKFQFPLFSSSRLSSSAYWPLDGLSVAVEPQVTFILRLLSIADSQVLT